MKAKIILYLMVLIIIGSCTQQKTKFPIGAWQLVYAKWTISDSLTFVFPGNVTGSDVKIWSENNFVFVGQFKMDTVIHDNFGGGTYKLEGNRYVESVQYHASKEYLGQNVKMILELKNDTLFETFPVDDNGQIDKSNYNIEKYVRLK